MDGMSSNPPPLRSPRDTDAPKTGNLATLVCYDSVLRTGWIFKTESVIMPAFLDLVAGPGWIRGCLLVVNRFGQSIPPALFARRLARLSRKKHALAVWTTMMAVPFLALAGIWSVVGRSPPEGMAHLFLLLYGVFSCCHGLTQISYATLQAKLLPVRLRGRLMLISVPCGSVFAVGFALWLMGTWLDRDDGGFARIFGFTGICFLVAGALSLLLREPADPPAVASRRRRHPLTEAYGVLRGDRNFRHLAIVVMLTAIGTVLFPHYQALARQRLQLAGDNLMVWVVVQNAALGVFGLLLGWVVERRGERLGLRCAIFGCAAAPVTALIVAAAEIEVARRWFWLVFVPLGMTPMSIKTMTGYVLEIAPADEHPRYLSALSLCLAVPFCFSPLVGWCVDLFGFEWVFRCGAALIGLAGLLTFGLVEPRHDLHGGLEALPDAVG